MYMLNNLRIINVSFVNEYIMCQYLMGWIIILKPSEIKIAPFSSFDRVDVSIADSSRAGRILQLAKKAK